MPTIIPTQTLQSGQVVPARPFPAGTFEVWLDGSGYNCLTDADLTTYPPPSSPRSTITPVLSGSSVTVLPTYFGMHVQGEGDLPLALTEINFNAVRSHDSGGAGGMRWCTLNPSNGVFNWTNSDNWINAMWAAGKTIIFLLGFTPNWAAVATPNTGKYDNGTTVTGSNQMVNSIAAWDNFCAAVATRYLGKIAFYEIWNEVNYTSYWDGTPADLALLTRRANQVIKAIDPAAKIVGPIVQEPETGGTGNAYLQAFLAASDGATGTGKDWIDICGIHMYPPRYNYQVHKSQIDNVRASLTAAGVGSLEIWNTEVGVLQGASIADPVQSKWLRRSMLLAAALDVKRYWWYSFDNTLMWMTDGDIAAWNEIRSILLSGPITGCNIAPDGRVAARVNGVNYIF